MTYGQQLFKESYQKRRLEGKMEGKLEGIQQEKLNLTLKLIADEVPLELVSLWTELSLSQLEDLSKQKKFTKI
jgi:predicted transposase YdaD